MLWIIVLGMRRYGEHSLGCEWGVQAQLGLPGTAVCTKISSDISVIMKRMRADVMIHILFMSVHSCSNHYAYAHGTGHL